MQKINPVVTDTTNLSQTIQDFLKIKHLEPSNLDFDILNVSVNAVNTQSGISIAFNTSSGDVIPEDMLDNPMVKLQQKLKVVLKSLELNPPIIKCSVNIDENGLNAIIVLKKNSVLMPIEKSAEAIYETIQKKLAYKNILLYQFEGNLRSQIKQCIDNIKDTQMLDEDVIIIASTAYKYKPTINDSLEYLYLRHQEHEQDLYDRDFIKEVFKGNILIEYKKPQDGISGRNCFGEYIEATVTYPTNAPIFRYDEESIAINENDDYIRFVAAKSGSVELENNFLRVNDSINIQSINAKDTGSIKLDNKDDLYLNVLEENPVYDAVGPSMKVKATHVHIKGSVGESAQIDGNDVQVDGITHATSKVFAKDKAKIKNHRGYCDAKEANIDNLEGGTLKCEVATIKNTHNGSVFCKRAYIENLGSNSKIIATEIIEITNIIGEDNELSVVSSTSLKDEESVNKLIESTNEIKEVAKVQAQEYNQLIKYIKTNKNAIDDIKLKIQQNPVNANKIYIDKVYEYQQASKRAAELYKIIQEQKEKISYYNHEIDLVKNRIFHAKICCTSPWRGKQTIKFQAPDNKFYYYTPAANLIIPSIKLGTSANDEYFVKASD